MRADEDARHARVCEQSLDEALQTFLVHVLAEEEPDAQTLREPRVRHRRVSLPPAVDEDAAHPTPLLLVRLPRRLTVNQRQFVGESRHGADGHPVRDEHDGHAAPARREVEGDAVRVAVARHHG